MKKKKLIVLALIALIFLSYSGYLIYKASPLYMNIETIIEKNFEMLNQSDELLIHGEVSFPVKINEVEYNQLHYYANLLYEKNDDSIALLLSPDESFKSNIMEITFSNDEMNMYMIAVEGGEREPLYTETFQTTEMFDLKKIVNRIFKESKGSSFEKKGVNVIENGKKIKKWGYVLSDSFSTSVLLENTNERFIEEQSVETKEFLEGLSQYLKNGEVNFVIHADDEKILKAIILKVVHPDINAPIEVLFTFDFINGEVE